MPERQLPIMRAPTLNERMADAARDATEAVAAQPLAQLLDLLGLTDLAGVADSFSDPDYRSDLKQGMAPRRVPIIGKAGARIPRNSQAGVGTPEANMAKIPRFRSPLGTFIKHEGQWWRVKKQPAASTDVTLELLPPGVPEPGVAPEVLRTLTLSADDLIGGVRKAKGVREPVRNKSSKPRF